MDREIERRRRLAAIGKRDPDKDLADAKEALRSAHRLFQQSRDRKTIPSAHAQDVYAKALREVEICERVLEDIERLEGIA